MTASAAPRRTSAALRSLPADATEQGSTSPRSLDDATLRFIEDLAILYERAGDARMLGRITAWLLVADPPHQSASQIAAALGASKGSISTNLRFLLERGMIERFTLPPERLTYYRVAHGMWPETVRRGMAMMHALRHLAERGLSLLVDADGARRARLQEMADFYAFYEEETDAMLDRWRRLHDMTGAAHPRRASDDAEHRGAAQ